MVIHCQPQPVLFTPQRSDCGIHARGVAFAELLFVVLIIGLALVCVMPLFKPMCKSSSDRSSVHAGKRGGDKPDWDPKTKVLSLRNVTDVELQQLTQLPNLKQLNLRNPRITDDGWKHLGSLRNLEVLSLFGAQISGEGLRHLGELKHFVFLELSWSQIDNSALQHVGALQGLTHFIVNVTNVNDEGLVYLSELDNLQALHLAGTDITDSGCEHLKSLAGLTYLGLDDTFVSDAMITELEESLPNCAIRGRRPRFRFRAPPINLIP
jgi:hypothetical protein